MASSDYEDIYSIFLGKITDPELATEKQKIAYEYMNEYLISTASDPAIRKLFNSITFDDDMEEVTFELNRTIDDAYDKRFVNNLFATGMLLEWIRPQLNSKVLMSQFFGGKEQQLRNILLVFLQFANLEKSVSVFLLICWKPLHVVFPKHN